MATATSEPATLSSPGADEPDPRRFRALAIIAIAQLMIVLDASVVTIALPSAQRALHISRRQPPMGADRLHPGLRRLAASSAGGLADYLGRKRMFIISLLGFAAASALGGARPGRRPCSSARGPPGSIRRGDGPGFAVVADRDLHRAEGASQGLRRLRGRSPAVGPRSGWSSAELSPSTPRGDGRCSSTCRSPSSPRRWPPVNCAESRADGEHHYDIPGAVTVTAGLLSLVYGFTRAAAGRVGFVDHGRCSWRSAIVLLTTFVLIERRTATPLLPLRVVLDRNRGGSFLASLLVGIALFGTFLFLTFYLQGTLHYSALKSGFAFLPFSAGIIVSATAG